MTTFDDDSVMLAAAQVYDDDGDYLLDEAWQYKVSVNFLQVLLKLSRNKKDLNDVTAAPFVVSFSQRPAGKHTTNRAAVTA